MAMAQSFSVVGHPGLTAVSHNPAERKINVGSASLPDSCRLCSGLVAIRHQLSGRKLGGRSLHRSGVRCQADSTFETAAAELPGHSFEAFQIARRHFAEEVAPPKEDSQIDLAKAALLISGEDEALAYLERERDVAAAKAEGREFPAVTSTALQNLQRVASADDVLSVSVGGGNIQKWLNRLNALAREADICFKWKNGEASPHYPLKVLSAVNEVLFKNQGYIGNKRPGDPRNSHLHLVLQRGIGTSAMLSIVYMEVCKRVGFKLVGLPIHEDSFLTWPLVEDMQMVFSAYNGGRSYFWDEVEPRLKPYINPAALRDNDLSPENLALFESDPEVLNSSGMPLRPATNRGILKAVLRTLRNSHLARATRTLPDFALLAPLRPVSPTCTTKTPTGTPAIFQGGLRPQDMRLAINASERLLILFPNDVAVRRDHALLLYHDRRYADAVVELGRYMEVAPEQDAENVKPLIDRLYLMQLEESMWRKEGTTPAA